MSKYAELDTAILAAIDRNSPHRQVKFLLILHDVRVWPIALALTPPRSEPFRTVDARLQSMRKKGLIAYTAKGGWKLAEVPT